MARGTQALIDLRRRRIMELLEARPQTIVDLMDNFEANYYTIRRDVYEMEKEGLVYPTGDRKGAALVWAAGMMRPIPEFRAGRTDFARMDMLAYSYLANPESSTGSRAVLTLARVLVELLALASQADLLESNISQTSIDSLKEAAEQSMVSIEAVLNIGRAMLASDIIWKPSTLKHVTTDLKFSSREYLTQYEAFIRAQQDAAEQARRSLTVDMEQDNEPDDTNQDQP